LCDRLDSLSPSIAIVGTRKPSAVAAEFAYEIAADLARAGVTVVSGGAVGIDAAAHVGALDAGGNTVVVLPTTLDSPGPHINRPIFARAQLSGALVALFDQPRGPNFFQRNAVIAALADATVVVAAPIKSGARNTAAAARKLGRPLWIVPGAIWDETMAGCACELAIGEARALIDSATLLASLGIKSAAKPRVPKFVHRVPEASSPAPTPLPLFDMPESIVLKCLQTEAQTLDSLVAKTGLAPGLIQVELLTRALEGILREDPPGVYSIAYRGPCGAR
jgi:DNA processing protein